MPFQKLNGVWIRCKLAVRHIQDHNDILSSSQMRQCCLRSRSVLSEPVYLLHKHTPSLLDKHLCAHCLFESCLFRSHLQYVTCMETPNLKYLC